MTSIVVYIAVCVGLTIVFGVCGTVSVAAFFEFLKDERNTRWGMIFTCFAFFVLASGLFVALIAVVIKTLILIIEMAGA